MALTADTLTEAQLVAIRDEAHRKADFLRDFPRYAEGNFSDPVIRAVIRNSNENREHEIRWFRGVAYDAQAVLDGCDDCLDEVWQALSADDGLHYVAFNLPKRAAARKAA